MKASSLHIFALAVGLAVAVPASATPSVGAISAVPSSIPANQTTSVTVTVSVSDPTAVLPGGVNLLQVDAGGKLIRILGVMHDDGQNGDKTAGDGMFTLAVSLPGEAAMPAVYVQASAAFTGIVQRIKSSVLTILIKSSGEPFTITGFSPQSGPIGTLVTVSLQNFTPTQGSAPQVKLAALNGGTIAAPVSSFSTNTLAFVIPAGAGTGTITAISGNQSASSTASLSVTTSSTFSLSAGPVTATLVAGQTAAYAVTVTSSNAFDGLVQLSVSGVPNGIQTSFSPRDVAAGQTSSLTLASPANQSTVIASLTISGTATIDGQAISRSQVVKLAVSAPTTSFLARTAVDDTQETPIAGVTVKFLNRNTYGKSTGCSAQTTSDAAGNVNIANLPSACVGSQLISYDGSTASSPPGKYAGVNLSYTLTTGQATTSPVLVHLPRIDNGETVKVQQNSATDQVFSFQSMPGLSVTVYKGTTFTLDDGTQPDPFPLTAVNVPLDRLPEKMASTGVVTPFIVAFQPANAVSNQPVAVNFPNSLRVAPGTNTTLMTLDPTLGYMVPYGTGTVSSDARQILADNDPVHPGHQFGLVHFDWHGPVLRPLNQINPCFDSYCPCVTHPVDLASGLPVIRNVDIAIPGSRGSIYIERVYRPAFVYGINDLKGGPFGYGTNHNYGYSLNVVSANVINLVLPDGNQFPYAKQADGSYQSSGVPLLAGSRMTQSEATDYDLRWKDGTTYHFSSYTQVVSYELLSSIRDNNGNVTTLTYNGANLIQVTDPVGRWFKIHYKGGQSSVFGPIDVITDSSGRTVKYEYTKVQGGPPNTYPLMTTFTNANGEKTSYDYNVFPSAPVIDGAVKFITNSRSIVTARYTYDINGRVIKEQLADNSMLEFAYTLSNPSVGTSPVVQTVVTDGLHHQTTYRFNSQGFLIGVTNALGQTRTLDRDGDNNVVAIHGSGACPVCGDTAAGDETMTYDSLGNVTSITDALGNQTQYAYDPTFNKLTTITDALKNQTSLAYDSNGNLSKITDPNKNQTVLFHNGYGELVKMTDALNKSTVFAYDPEGNLVSTTDPLNNVRGAVYDAVSRPIQLTDPNGGTTAITYDAADRIKSIIDATHHTTSFAYDLDGDLTSITDGNGNQTNYSYDSMDRLQSMTDPLGHSDSRSYDFDGNLVSFKDRRGQQSVFTYDALDRLVGEQYDDGSQVSRTYDANGRLSAVVDSGRQFDFTYDAAGRLLSSANQFGTVEYTYDQRSKLISRQVVGQAAVQYAFDKTGNLTSAQMPQASVSLHYDFDNRLSRLDRQNGVTSVYNYDGAGNLLSIQHAGGAISVPLTYSYDPNDNRSVLSTVLGRPLGSSAVSSAYDKANQLISSSSSSGTASYKYDYNGNLTGVQQPTGTTTYDWDTRNRLIAVSEPNGKATSLTYDFVGNLITQTMSSSVANESVSFSVDRTGNVASISSDMGNSVNVLNGVLVDQDFATVSRGGEVQYALKDALNSTTATADVAGNLSTAYTFDPYGAANPPGPYPFLFTGRTLAGNGLLYLRSRFYLTSIGRFLSQDVLPSPRSSYSYASNSPLSATDPWGLFPLPPPVGGLSTTSNVASRISPDLPALRKAHQAACRRRAISLWNFYLNQFSLLRPHVIVEDVTFVPIKIFVFSKILPAEVLAVGGYLVLGLAVVATAADAISQPNQPWEPSADPNAWLLGLGPYPTTLFEQ